MNEKFQNKIEKYAEINEGMSVADLQNKLKQAQEKIDELNKVGWDSGNKEEYQKAVDRLQDIQARLKNLGEELDNETPADPSFWINRGDLN
jgi:TolA-binding protein